MGFHKFMSLCILPSLTLLILVTTYISYSCWDLGLWGFDMCIVGRKGFEGFVFLG
jgi:hypothetical protein